MPWNPNEPITGWNFPPCPACDDLCDGAPCTCHDAPTSEDDHATIVNLTAERDALRAALRETREALADTLDLATKVAICEMEAMASKEPGSDVFGCAGIAEKAKVARARAAWKAFDDCVKPVLARHAALVEEVDRG